MAHVEVILDRSGSMQSVRKSTIEGFNEFVTAQPKGTTFTMTQFESQQGVILDEVFKDKKKPVLTHETYAPGGLTPLLDAVGSVLEQLLEAKRKGKVVVLIITDGHENASQDYSKKRVQELIAKAKKKRWQVVFMGADIDAYADAGTLGISADQTMAYASASTTEAYGSMARSVSNFTSGIADTVEAEDVK